VPECAQDMEPEQLVELIDFKHISEVVSKEEALELLKARRPEAMARKEEMKKDGFPAYTTSAGWLGYPEDKIRALCKDLMKDGREHRALHSCRAILSASERVTRPVSN
jgi:L-fuconate dehydratase